MGSFLAAFDLADDVFVVRVALAAIGANLVGNEDLATSDDWTVLQLGCSKSY